MKIRPRIRGSIHQMSSEPQAAAQTLIFLLLHQRQRECPRWLLCVQHATAAGATETLFRRIRLPFAYCRLQASISSWISTSPSALRCSEAAAMPRTSATCSCVSPIILRVACCANVFSPVLAGSAVIALQPLRCLLSAAPPAANAEGLRYIALCAATLLQR